MGCVFLCVELTLGYSLNLGGLLKVWRLERPKYQKQAQQDDTFADIGTALTLVVDAHSFISCTLTGA